ncbi:MAG: hypothetical protein R6V59_09470 [Dehalococcoidia bacterium]
MDAGYYLRNVLFNTEAHEAWLEEADDLFLITLNVYSRRYVEGDQATTKTDAFRMGAIFGALYEQLRTNQERKP